MSLGLAAAAAAATAQENAGASKLARFQTKTMTRRIFNAIVAQPRRKQRCSTRQGSTASYGISEFGGTWPHNVAPCDSQISTIRRPALCSPGHRGDLASGHGARAAELRHSEVLQSCAPSRDRLRTQDSMFWIGSQTAVLVNSSPFRATPSPESYAKRNSSRVWFWFDLFLLLCLWLYSMLLCWGLFVNRRLQGVAILSSCQEWSA